MSPIHAEIVHCAGRNYRRPAAESAVCKKPLKPGVIISPTPNANSACRIHAVPGDLALDRVHCREHR